MNDEIFFDGVKHISANDAASSSGFTRDYIGRLCRDGKIRGRRIGKNWYVDNDSFKTFLVTQEFAKSRRSENLAKERTDEYKAATAAPARTQSPALAESPKKEFMRTAYTVSPAIPVVSSVLTQRGNEIREKLQKALEAPTSPAMKGYESLAHMPGGFASAALQAVHVPTYTLTPFMEFVHKLVALTLTLALVLGTYAAVDPRYARFAAESVQDEVAVAIDSYRHATGGGLNELADRTQTQVATVAEHPQLAASALAGTFTDTIPGVAANFARALNTRVNNFVYTIAFPADLVRSIGIAGGDVNGSVAIEVKPYQQPTSPNTKTSSPASLSSGPSTVVNRPVVERVLTTERIVSVGGITEAQLNERLNQLSNKLTSQMYSVTSSASTPPASGGITNNLALTQRIDQLKGTTITNPTISGGSISGTGISASTLGVSGLTDLATTTVTGSLTVNGSVQLQNISLSSSTLSITGQSSQTSNLIQVVDATGTVIFAVKPDGTLLTSNASSTQVYTSLLVAGGATTTTEYTTTLGALNATTTYFTAFNATTTNATSTNFFATNASTTNLIFLNATGTNATTTNFFATLGHFTTGIIDTLSSAVATITSLTATNATTTNATSTNFFATTASSTNLFSSLASIGTLTLVNALHVASGGTGAQTFGQGWIFSSGGTGALSASTSPTVNYVTATSTTQSSTFAGGILSTPGSASAPGFGFTGASNSGIYSVGSSNVRVSAGGTFALDVSGSQVYTPLTGTASGPAFSIYASNLGLFTPDSGTSLGFSTGGSERMRLNSSGLGIGTTTPATLLSVQGAGYISSGLFVGGTITSTSTSASTFPYASSTALTATNLFSTNFLTLGSTTLQNFTALNATTSNATSTTFFATTASSTNLFSQSASLGALTSVSQTFPSFANALLYADGSGRVSTASVGASLTFSAGALSLNVANGNSWTGLQQFANSTSTLFSATQKAYFGTTGQSSFDFNGALTLGTALGQASGGTGLASYTAGDILYANNSGILTKLAIGSAGNVLTVQAGLPAWGVSSGGGGGSSGFNMWATTTLNLIYPVSTAYPVSIGANATSSLNSIFEVHGNQYVSGSVGIATTSPATTLSVGGSGYFTGGVGVGVLNTSAGTFQTSGNATVGGTLLLPALSTNSLLYNNGFTQVAAATVGSSLTFSAGALSLNTANANTWSVLQTFSNASSTLFSNIGTAYFGATATTTIGSTGSIVIPAAGTLQVGGGTTLSSALTYGGVTLSNAVTGTGNMVLSAAPTFTGTAAFANATHTGTLSVTGQTTLINASSTLFSNIGTAYFGATATSTFDSTGFLTLPSGFLSQASSTIGNGTQSGGLTISGGATTTLNAYFAGNVGIGTQSPSKALEVVSTDGVATILARNTNSSSYAQFTATNDQNAPTTRAAVFGYSGSATGAAVTNGVTGEQGFQGTIGAFPFTLYTNNTARITVSGSANKVGIGTSTNLTAGGTLNLATTNGTDALDIINTSSSNKAYTFYPSGNDLRLFEYSGAVGSSGSDRLTFQAGGNVGIGTTTPFYKLSVEGTSSLGNQAIAGYFTATSTTASTFLNASSTLLSVFNKTYFGGTATSTFDSTGALTLVNALTYGGVTLSNAVTGTGNMVLSAAPTFTGTAAFANATHTGTLSVTGQTTLINASSTLFSNIGTAYFGGTATTTINSTGTITVTSTSANTFPYASTTALTASGSAYFATSGGSVGIGTTTPSAKFSIQGTAGSGQILDIASSTGATLLHLTAAGNFGVGTTTPWGLLSINPNGITGPSFVIGSSTATSFIVTNGGNVGLGTSSPTTILSLANATLPTVNLDFTTTNSNGALTFSQGGVSGAAVRFEGSTVAQTERQNALEISSIGPINFRNTTGTEFGRFNASGMFGVGTSTPWGQIAISTPTQQSGTIPLFNIASTTNTSLFTALGNGNIGIGTTTPQARLEIVDVSAATTTPLFITNFGFATSSTDVGLAFRTDDVNHTTGTTTASISSIIQQNFGTGKGDLVFSTLNSGAVTEAMRLTSSGFLGIGTTTANTKLAVSQTTTNPQFTIGYDVTHDYEERVDSAGGLNAHASGKNIYAVNDNFWVCTGGTNTSNACPAGAPTGQGNLIVANKIGIATSTPNWPLQVAGTQPSFAISDSNAGANLKHWLLTSMNGLLYIGTSSDAYATTSIAAITVTNAGKVGIGSSTPTTLLSVGGLLSVGASSTGQLATMGTATSTFNGDVKITGKLDVSTIDPVYSIDGVKYATYGDSTIGIHEETLQTIELTEKDPSTGKYSYTIKFDTLDQGSDLWLFYQITDFGSAWKSLVISLTPSFDGKVFYKKVPGENKLVISGDAPGEVSMRLSATRFDWSTWPTLRRDQDDKSYKGFELTSKPVISQAAAASVTQ